MNSAYKLLYSLYYALAVAVLALDHGLAQNQEIPVNFDTSNIAAGQYNFQFKTPNQIQRQENGNFDINGNYIVQGSYSYVNDLNQRVAYSYIADINGYRASPLPPQPVSSQVPGAGGVSAPPYITAALLGG